MYYGKAKRCEWCGKICTDADLKFQNTKAMYLSERRATYWHQACFDISDAQNKAYREELQAQYALFGNLKG